MLLGQMYPDKTLLDNDPNSFPRNLTLDEFCRGPCHTRTCMTPRKNNTTAALEGLLIRSYEALALGDYDRYVGLRLLAQKGLCQIPGPGRQIRKRTTTAPNCRPSLKTSIKSSSTIFSIPNNGLPYAAPVLPFAPSSRCRRKGKPLLPLFPPIPVPASLSSPTNAPSTNSVVP